MKPVVTAVLALTMLGSVMGSEPAAAASAPTQIELACEKSPAYDIKDEGSYVLAVEPEVGTCNQAELIRISASNVTLDLAGLSLDPGVGSICEDAIVATTGLSNVGVKHGTLSNCATGIDLRGASPSSIKDVQVLNSGSDAVLVGDHSTIKRCTVNTTGNNGIDAGMYLTISDSSVDFAGLDGISAASHSLIESNHVTHSAFTGIWAGGQGKGPAADDGRDQTITGNTVSKSGVFGIYAGKGSTVSGNTSTENSHIGVAVIAPSLVKKNTSSNNEKGGITVYGGKDGKIFDTQVLNNTTEQNAYAGISIYDPVRTPVDTTVSGNKSNDNGWSGIEVNAYGGKPNGVHTNTAHGNGFVKQCDAHLC